jgi:hypothetical protein
MYRDDVERRARAVLTVAMVFLFLGNFGAAAFTSGMAYQLVSWTNLALGIMLLLWSKRLRRRAQMMDPPTFGI